MKITLDGKQIQVGESQSVLEVARENDIYIPSLCDNPGLHPFSGCRLCLVEIKGQRGYSPSCGTLVREGMEVKSNTPKLQKIRRQILELILSEHPSSCLICSEKKLCDDYKSTIRKVGETTGCVLCPNNGRCDLQDVVNALEIDSVRFPSLYRDLEIKKKDPFFDRNYNLCILCGRCVRVCQEIRGASALTFVHRGSEAVIGTVLDKPLQEAGCRFCGACVDTCPTGALSDRALKYERRADKSVQTICSFCSMGCSLEIAKYQEQILGSKPSQSSGVNLGQACVKGRFLLKDTVYSKKRILKPMIRKERELEEVSWEEALNFASKKLKTFDKDSIEFSISPQMCNEDIYIMEKFSQNALKTGWAPSSQKTFYELLYELEREHEFKMPTGFNFEEIAEAETILIMGTDVVVSSPLVWLSVLKALRKGANLIIATPVETGIERFASVVFKLKPGKEAPFLGMLIRKIIETNEHEENEPLSEQDDFIKNIEELDEKDVLIEDVVNEELLFSLAAGLLKKEGKTALLLGGCYINPSARKNVLALSLNFSRFMEGQLFLLEPVTNSRGRAEIREAFLQKIALSKPLNNQKPKKKKALYSTGTFSLPEEINPEFIIVQDCYWSEEVNKADVVFPASSFVEREGTTINIEGKILKSESIIEELGDSKPDWWIVSNLAQKMGMKGFSYNKHSDVFSEMASKIPLFSGISKSALNKGKQLFSLGEGSHLSEYLPAGFSGDKNGEENHFPFLLYFDNGKDSYRNLNFIEENKGYAHVRYCGIVFINPEEAKKFELNENDRITVYSKTGSCETKIKFSSAISKGFLKASFSPDLHCLMQSGFTPVFLPVDIKRGQ